MNTKLFITSVLATALFAHSSTTFAAKYEVKELTPLENYRQHFSMGLNDSGTVVGVVRDSFNFSFYNEEYLTTLYETSCALDESETSSGVFDAGSTYCLKVKLASEASATNALYQKVGDSKSFISSNDDTSLIVLTDYVDELLGSYTNSNVEQISEINNNGVAVGTASAPFNRISFTATAEDEESGEVTSTDYILWERDYKTRAAIYNNGTVTLIEPEFAEYGGSSSAVDISNTGYIGGYASVDLVETQQTAIETDCTGETAPLLVCVWSKQLSTNNIYKIRPYIWQIDDSGDVISTVQYDLGITPSETDTNNYTATVTAVNDFGVGVGYGHVYNNEEDKAIRTQPLLFGTEGTTSLIDNDEYDAGYASDINSSAIVVGKVQTRNFNTSDGFDDEFFIYDVNNDTFETPVTFYLSAESSANAINDNGKVIGEAEYEVTDDDIRRKHGFIYDINTKDFFDINDLTECGSEFEIVAMNNINNNNQIAATALKLVDLRDSTGEIVYDANGETYPEEIAVSVLLTPIPSGEVEDCSDIENPPYERKGLSTSPLILFLLSSLLYIRRRSL